jgi:hypothetical protein
MALRCLAWYLSLGIDLPQHFCCCKWCMFGRPSTRAFRLRNSGAGQSESLGRSLWATVTNLGLDVCTALCLCQHNEAAVWKLLLLAQDGCLGDDKARIRLRCHSRASICNTCCEMAVAVYGCGHSGLPLFSTRMVPALLHPALLHPTILYPTAASWQHAPDASAAWQPP